MSTNFCQSSSGGKSTFSSFHRTYSSVSSFSQNFLNVCWIRSWSSLKLKSIIGPSLFFLVRGDVRLLLTRYQTLGFLPELFHNRLDVRGIGQPLDRIAFQRQGSIQTAAFQRTSHDFLGHSQCNGFFRADIRYDFTELCFELIILEYAGEEAHLIHIAGQKILAAAVDDFSRPINRHGPDNAHGASPAGQDSHVDLGGPELSRFPGIDKVAHQGQFESTGKAMTGHLGNYHLFTKL